MGMVNLFLHVCQHPNLPDARADALLLDTIVGHFSYLEHSTGAEPGSTLARKLVAHVRSRIERAQKGAKRASAFQPAKVTPYQSNRVPDDSNLFPPPPDPISEPNLYDMSAFDVSARSMLMPSRRNSKELTIDSLSI
jgi:hypothetical protein